MKHQTLEKPKYRLIWQGILIGIFSGLMAVFYRWLLGVSEDGRNQVLQFLQKTPALMIVWFLLLVAIAWVVSRLLKSEPMISGSGIPQLEGEFHGKFVAKPFKVLALKMIGGALSVFSGLSLGREGPSIQLGAMGGRILSDGFKRDGEEKNFLLLCGASAGLSAAFNAPLAGVLFAVEEVYKTISPSLLFSVMVSSVTADFISKLFFGTGSVFSFPAFSEIPLSCYWLLLLLGLILGVLGLCYNKTLLWTQKQYQKLKYPFLKLLIPFLLAGVLGIMLPLVLGGGHKMVEHLEQPGLLLSSMLILLIAKFLFSMLSFGSGAPGGIFFPLLVLGAYIGAIFATVAISALSLPTDMLFAFVIMAMAGYFTAIVHAPVTGILLLCEMTGSFGNILPMAVVCTVSYLVTHRLANQPIYDSLLERMLKK